MTQKPISETVTVVSKVNMKILVAEMLLGEKLSKNIYHANKTLSPFRYAETTVYYLVLHSLFIHLKILDYKYYTV